MNNNFTIIIANPNNGLNIEESGTDTNYIPFYFPKIEYRDSFVDYNESNSLIIFIASDNKYHNISLHLNITKGEALIDPLVENCEDYGAVERTNGLIGMFSFNFVAYNVELKAQSDSNQSIPNNYFPYTVEVNGSYFLEDFGPTKWNMVHAGVLIVLNSSQQQQAWDF